MAANITFGLGSAVSSAERIATFDSVRTGMILSSYTEDGLKVSAGGLAFIAFSPGFGFSEGFYYSGGAYPTPTKIQANDSSTMYGLEFTLGTGFFSQIESVAFLAWETYLFGQRTDYGWFTANLSKHTIVGVSDFSGFDELRVANYESLAEVGMGISGRPNGLAIDTLRVQLTKTQGDTSSVPEPSTTVLVLAGLSSLAAIRYVLAVEGKEKCLGPETENTRFLSAGVMKRLQ